MPISYKRPQQMTATQAAHAQGLQKYYQAQAQAMQQHAMMQAMYNGTQTSTTGSAWVSLSGLNGGTYTTTATTATTGTVATTVPAWAPASTSYDGSNIIIKDGAERTIFLPDGTFILVGKDGSFTINDKDAKVTYRANRVRDFNSFVNASDKLEDFIKFCGAQGVRQGEMLDLPIKLFIGWLILQAAMADGENPEPVELLEDIHDHVTPRCVGCGRFISRKIAARKITVCSPVCLERELAA